MRCASRNIQAFKPLGQHLVPREGKSIRGTTMTCTSLCVSGNVSWLPGNSYAGGCRGVGERGGNRVRGPTRPWTFWRVSERGGGGGGEGGGGGGRGGGGGGDCGGEGGRDFPLFMVFKGTVPSGMSIALSNLSFVSF